MPTCPRAIYDHFASKDGWAWALARALDGLSDTSTKREPRLLAQQARDDRRRVVPALDPEHPSVCARVLRESTGQTAKKSDQVDDQSAAPESNWASSENLIEQSMRVVRRLIPSNPLLTARSSGRPERGGRAEMSEPTDGLRPRRGSRVLRLGPRLVNEGLTSPAFRTSRTLRATLSSRRPNRGRTAWPRARAVAYSSSSPSSAEPSLVAARRGAPGRRGVR